jgi:hypothetical protein
MHMINTQTAAEFTFVTDTYGGRRAVSDLKQQVVNARRVRPGAVPIVKLAVATMPTKFGIKPRPALKVVDWRGGVLPTDEPKQLDQQHRYSPDRPTPSTTSRRRSRRSQTSPTMTFHSEIDNRPRAEGCAAFV